IFTIERSCIRIAAAQRDLSGRCFDHMIVLLIAHDGDSFQRSGAIDGELEFRRLRSFEDRSHGLAVGAEFHKYLVRGGDAAAGFESLDDSFAGEILDILSAKGAVLRNVVGAGECAELEAVRESMLIYTVVSILAKVLNGRRRFGDDGFR